MKPQPEEKLVRCCFWKDCPNTQCDHYQPHAPIWPHGGTAECNKETGPCRAVETYVKCVEVDA